MRIILILIGFSVLIQGCTSKVDEILDNNTKEERALKEIEEAKERSSKVEILENSTSENQAICISTNQIKILLTENSDQPIKCQDKTKLDAQLKPGPICPGGVELKMFNPPSTSSDCSQVTLCGVKPSKSIPLSTGNSTLKMTQLIYDRLPWGCSGSLSVQGAQQAEVVINVKPPPCEYCKDKGISTCEACGDDKIPPKFSDVIVDKSKCRTFNILVFAEDAESGLHREPYSFDGGRTWTDVNRTLVEGRTLSLPAETIWIRDRGGNIAKYTTVLNDTAMLCGCATPWGENLAHNETRTVFQVTQVECEQSCDGQSQVRKCEDGTLSGGNNFKYLGCAAKTCPGCTTPWGELVKHRDTVTAYKQDNVSCKDQCELKSSVCDKGKWTQDLIGFAQKECKFTYPKCDCAHNGNIIKNSETKPVYSKESYACNETPKSGNVTCTMGALSGNTDYNFFTFSTKPCKCLAPWGGTLEKDEIRDAFKVKVTTCADKFSCHDVSNKIKIKCIDNINNTIQLVEGIGPIEDYKESTCDFKPCKCRHLNKEFGPNDPPLAVFRTNIAYAPSRCDLNGNKGIVKCGPDITLSGDTSAAFPYTECKDETSKGDGTGNSDYEIGLGAGGGSGGGIGNDEGDGEGFRRRSKGGGGGACNQDSSPYYCLNFGVSLYTGLSDQFCLLPGLDGYSLSNTESTNYTQRIESGGWIAAFSQKEVVKPDSCLNHRGLIKCSDGKMSEPDKYKYLNCTERN